MLFSDRELLFFSCLLLTLVSLLGGWIPNLFKITHVRLQSAMSLVAGFMVGIAVLHLLPHSVSIRGDNNALDAITLWFMVGLATMFVMIRSFHFHQHEQPPIYTDNPREGDNLSPASLSYNWIGVALGFSIHSFIEGAALVAALQLQLFHSSHFPWIWLGVLMAILLHKPLDSMSISFLIKEGGWKSSTNYLVNILFALICPLGALIFYFGATKYFDLEFLSNTMAFSSGAFVCIALSDLLPEAHQHTHDRFTLTIMFLVGVLFSYLLRIMEVNAGLTGHF